MPTNPPPHSTLETAAAWLAVAALVVVIGHRDLDPDRDRSSVHRISNLVVQQSVTAHASREAFRGAQETHELRMAPERPCDSKAAAD